MRAGGMVAATARRVGSSALLAALAAAMLAASADPTLVASSDDSETVVDIPDAALRRAVETALGKSAGDPVARGEMATLVRLDAGYVGVRELTGIEHATNLERLGLARNEIAELGPLSGLASLTTLSLGGNEIADVSPLSGLTALTSLTLYSNKIADLSPLSGLASLTRLNLGANEIADVSPLSGLTALTSLDLWINHIADLSPLSGLASLTALDLSSNELTDVSALSGLTSLTSLELWFNQIADISPLSGLTSLTSLHLSYNFIADVSPLAGMTSLTELRLSNNRTTARYTIEDGHRVRQEFGGSGSGIADVSPLAGLTSLTTLELSRNQVTDVSPLAGMTSLKSLALENNEIADVSPLSEMKSLTRLSLGKNGVFDLSPLASLTSLTSLDLSYNEVAQLDALADLTSLTSLRLVANQIVDLVPLAGMVSLTTLGLNANLISDVSPLVANDGLDHGDSVSLRGNPIGRESREAHIPALRRRGVEVAFDPPTELPEVPDVRLREALALALAPADTFATLEDLDASALGIEDLTGLEGATELRDLFLDRNRITDIAPLSALRYLATLTLAYNMVEDLSPLAAMEYLQNLALDGNSLRDLPSLPRNLRYLYLSDNSISNIASLADLRGLLELDVGGNSIASLAPLGRSAVEYLHVHDNKVADLSPLHFGSLRELHFRNNAVRDLSPLLDAQKLLMVDARRNPLSERSLAVLDTLRGRRVTVLAGETVPYFPAAGGSRQGFARIVNRSDEDGHVFVEAVDDAGVPARRVRLRVGARQAVHFNSEDLERGNPARGLSGGIGPPTAGDWRLSVISALDIEALSYVRTDDGFVTAMHDVLPDATAAFFNPGSNQRQRSILRVVNTEAEPAKWTTGGFDDAGRWRPMAGSLLVRPRHALALTAQALEGAHGLGDGRGKWRLRTRGFPWFAMSLLESPTGHLANLSTAPDNATPLADGGALHRLPLFPAAGGAREGFARVINRSYAAGTVAIEAVDDRGDRFGPLQLALGPRRAAHFNATDLEVGNAAKGWGGVGGGRGDWRLEVTSELELTVLAYARTASGFVTSVHDLAPTAEDGSHRVVFFNPGSNTRQASRLRLINDGGRAAQVTVAGIDDLGNEPGTVALAVPAGAALGLSSAELEAGSGRLAGRLGDGAGKWRLRVRSDAPISVMSLLETPSGHLTNVSTGTAD